MKKTSRLLLAAALLGAPGLASAQAPAPAAPTAAELAKEANKLAQGLANPVADLGSMSFQFNNYNLPNDPRKGGES